MPWIWRRCLARRASASVERREPEVSASAAIGFRNDGEAEPMVSPLIGTCPKIYGGKPLGLVSSDPAGSVKTREFALFFNENWLRQFRSGPECRQDGIN